MNTWFQQNALMLRYIKIDSYLFFYVEFISIFYLEISRSFISFCLVLFILTIVFLICIITYVTYTCMHTRSHTHIHTWPTRVNTSRARVNLSPSLIVATVTVKKQNLCTANENIGFMMCYSLRYQLLITTSSILYCICHSVKK